MNSKTVLNKIMTMLAITDNVELTYAKLKDGTIVESKTFDVGQELFVVTEDGKRTPAPDGTHELMLRDTEGNETMLKVISKDGKIEERENVEMADEDADMVEVKPIPESDGAKPVEDTEMAEVTDSVEPLPEDEEKDEEPSIEIELKDMVEKLAYRIEEMEKKMTEMGKMKEEEEKMKEETKKEDDVDMELPKLDGAPVDDSVKFSSVESNKKVYGKKVQDAQSSFLSKLYK